MASRSPVVVFSVLVALAIMWNDARAQWQGNEGIKVEGMEMSAYSAPDQSYSLLYPKQWTVQQSGSGVTIVKDLRDRTSARIDLFVLPLGQPPLTGRQIVDLLAAKMKELYPSFSLLMLRQLSTQPDAVAVMFSYDDADVKMSGFALAASLGTHALWADIYGKDAAFTGYNPTVLLTYVMQSMTQGPIPSIPKAPTATAEAAKAASTTTSKETQKAMLMTHYWNMYPHLYPGGVFRSGVW